jgi:hypothetical protein
MLDHNRNVEDFIGRNIPRIFLTYKVDFPDISRTFLTNVGLFPRNFPTQILATQVLIASKRTYYAHCKGEKINKIHGYFSRFLEFLDLIHRSNVFVRG